jgi:hypothetical protein
MPSPVNDVDAKRLQARSASHPMFTTAYVEIERRAEALERMRTTPSAQREGEPTAVRWARDDIKAFAHVGKAETSIALDAIARSMSVNRSYAATITNEAPRLINLVMTNKAERAIALNEAADAMALHAIRERSRDAEVSGVTIDRVGGRLKATSLGRGIDGMHADNVRQMARDDFRDLRSITRQDQLEVATAIIAGNMRNPTYKAEFTQVARHTLASRRKEAAVAQGFRRDPAAEAAPPVRLELQR